jgi:hypothetical protein
MRDLAASAAGYDEHPRRISHDDQSLPSPTKDLTINLPHEHTPIG